MSFPSADRALCLTRKQVCQLFQWSRITLWRRECEGLPFRGRTIELGALVEWMEGRGV